MRQSSPSLNIYPVIHLTPSPAFVTFSPSCRLTLGHCRCANDLAYLCLPLSVHPGMLRQCSGCRQNPMAPRWVDPCSTQASFKSSNPNRKASRREAVYTDSSQYHFWALSECQGHFYVRKTDKAGEDPRQILLPLAPRRGERLGTQAGKLGHELGWQEAYFLGG